MSSKTNLQIKLDALLFNAHKLGKIVDCLLKGEMLVVNKTKLNSPQ